MFKTIQRLLACVLVAAISAVAAPKVKTRYDQDLETATRLAKKLSQLYSAAKTAGDVGRLIATALGWIGEGPTTEQLVSSLRADMDEGFSDVDWHDTAKEVTKILGDARAQVLAIPSDDLQFDIKRDSTINTITLAAVETLIKDGDQNAFFYRRYVRAYDDGLLERLNFVGDRFTTADFHRWTLDASYVYDWRLGLPALMTAIAYRIQVVAKMNPNFRTDRGEMDRFRTYRQVLLKHYQVLQKGIKCGKYAHFCIDLYSHRYETPDYPLPTLLGRPSGGLGYYSVWASMPLYDLRAMIDTLQTYSAPPAPDLTELHHRIKSADARGNSWCLDAPAGLVPAPALVSIGLCNSATSQQSSQQWVYDRLKGTIVNSGSVAEPASGGCLTLTGGSDPFGVGVSPCNGGAEQRWSYDPYVRERPQSGRVTASNGTALAIRWERGSYRVVAVPVTDPVTAPNQWLADYTPVSGLPLFPNLLKPGESLRKGDSRFSPNNRYELVFEYDGNLVLYEKLRDNPGGETRRGIWDTRTNGKAVSTVTMQSNGNLAMYPPAAPCDLKGGCNPVSTSPSAPVGAPLKPVWESATSGNPGAYLSVENEGYLAIYRDLDTVWSTMIIANVYALSSGNAAYVSQTGPSSLLPGETRTVTVTMRNTGRNTWLPGDGYYLGAQNPAGNSLWGRPGVPLTKPVPPGSDAVFTFSVRAPATTGAYNMQWQMHHTAGGWFGDLTPNVRVNAINLSLDEARFVWQNVPTTMKAGTTYDVSIRMRNAGKNAWSAEDGFRLASQRPQGNTQWSETDADHAPATVVPNAEALFAFKVVAPSKPGVHTFEWRMTHNGVGFGDFTPVLAIVVVP